jgi:hypothetical protein
VKEHPHGVAPSTAYIKRGCRCEACLAWKRGTRRRVVPTKDGRARIVVRLPVGFASALVFASYLRTGGPWDVDQVAKRALERGLAGARGTDHQHEIEGECFAHAHKGGDRPHHHVYTEEEAKEHP